MFRFSNSSLLTVFAGILWISVGTQSTRAEVNATYELGPVTTNGNVFTIDVVLDVTTTLSEETVFFSVDVSDSDDALTNSGSDFGRFGFSVAPGLSGWTQIPKTGFGSGSLQRAVEFDTITNPLDAGRYQLGQLSFDASGLDASVFPATLSVESKGSTIGAQVPGQPPSFDFVSLDFAPGTISIAVPEPSVPLFECLIATLLAALALRRTRA